MSNFLKLLLLVVCLLTGRFAFADDLREVRRWEIFETALAGPDAGNPFVDVTLTARFKQDDREFYTPGFYDGDGTYRLRFMPDQAGQWQFTTESNVETLNGHTGSFLCTQPEAGNRGPVKVHKQHHFAYADGTSYLPFGTTCYAWVHQPKELQQQTLATLAQSPFNKLRFCIFPKSYTYNRNEPEIFPFVRRQDGTFDFERFDPLFWRQFETRLADLMQLGVEADLVLFHPYDRWGFAEMGRDADTRYLQYAIARLSAYRNVWWSLANEYDLMSADTIAGHRGNKSLEDWDRIFQLIQNQDPHQRLRSIHNWKTFYDHTKSWVTHASIQSHALNVGKWRDDFAKPIVVDECGYEGDIPQGWGNLSPQEMLRRVWIGTVQGGYVGHGETYNHPDEILWWSKGGVLRGESPARIAFLKRFVSQLPFQDLQPQPGPVAGSHLLAKPGEHYLLYFTGVDRAEIELPGDRPYKVDGIDPWKMTAESLGNAEPGRFTFTPPQPNYVLYISSYKPGEELRPHTAASDSPAEGIDADGA